MTTLALYGGPLKRDLIQQARGECGEASDEFELDADEYAADCRILDRLMYELRDLSGIDLGYNFPNPGARSNPIEESGLPWGAVSAIVSGLALKVAPTIGKTLSAEARASLARSFAALRGSYSNIPSMGYGRNTIRGAGNRWRYGGPFLPVGQRQVSVSPLPPPDIIYISSPVPSYNVTYGGVSITYQGAQVTYG